MLHTVRKTIEDNNLLRRGDGVVVGVSGGADSVALLYVLNEISKEFNLKIYVAHLDHMLRGKDAERDREYVCQLAKQMGLPVECRKVDVKTIADVDKISSEEAGRNARYELFVDVARKYGCNKIAVAHHKDDQVETVLLHLLRGSGLKGLSGMSAMRNYGEYTIIRPFINISKEKIEQYCEEIGVCPMIDYTNMESVYTRNKIRNHLIPLLKKEYNQRVVEAIARTADFCRCADEYIDKEARKQLNELTLTADSKSNGKSNFIKLCLKLKELSELDAPILERLLLLACFDLCGEVKGFYSPQIEALCKLIKKGNTGSSLDLPHQLTAKIEYDKFIIERIKLCKINLTQEKSDTELNLNGETLLNGTELKVDSVVYNNISYVVGKELFDESQNKVMSADKLVDIANKAFYELKNETEKLKVEDIGKRWAAFDFDKIKGDIILRPCKNADRIALFGISGSKLLSDIFCDMKMPREKRRQIYVAACDDEVLWILGIRTSRHVAVTQKTKKILFMMYKKQGE